MRGSKHQHSSNRHKKNKNYRNKKTVMKLIRKLKAADISGDKDQVAKISWILYELYLRLIADIIGKRVPNKDLRDDMFQTAYLLLLEAALKYKISMVQYHPDNYFRNALQWGFYKKQLKARGVPIDDKVYAKIEQVKDYMLANGGTTDYDSNGNGIFFPWTDGHKKACAELLGVTIPTLDSYLSFLWLEKIGSVEALTEESEKYEETGLGDKSQLLADDSGDPAGITLKKELRRVCNDAIENLPDKQRLAFLAMNREGVKNNIRQAGLYLGWSDDKVKNHYNKAIASLQETLSKYLYN